jgi:hypothetical protein
MRSLILAIAAAVGIGLLGVSGASATPANGAVIGKAVASDQLVQDVRWRGRGWGGRHWGGHWRGHWHRHWRWGSRGWHSRWRSWHRW